MEAVKVDQSEREEAVRKVLFDTFCQQYHSLASFIQKLPINHEMKSKIAFFMDSGFLWTKEAFVLQEIELQRASLAAVPPVETPAVADTAAASEKTAETA
jgi:hypothetical protein